jgi:hypothetical protein
MDLVFCILCLVPGVWFGGSAWTFCLGRFSGGAGETQKQCPYRPGFGGMSIFNMGGGLDAGYWGLA